MTSGYEIIRVSPAVSAGGYVANFHRLIMGVVVVEAPCGCEIRYGKNADSVYTWCGHDGCQFSYDLVSEAMEDLKCREFARDVKRNSQQSAITVTL